MRVQKQERQLGWAELLAADNGTALTVKYALALPPMRSRTTATKGGFDGNFVALQTAKPVMGSTTLLVTTNGKGGLHATVPNGTATTDIEIMREER